MSKTSETSNIATFERHDTLVDSELDAVTGGTATFRELAMILGQLEQAQAQNVMNKVQKV